MWRLVWNKSIDIFRLYIILVFSLKYKNVFAASFNVDSTTTELFEFIFNIKTQLHIEKPMVLFGSLQHLTCAFLGEILLSDWSEYWKSVISIDGGTVWKVKGPNSRYPMFRYPMFRASADDTNCYCWWFNTNVLSKIGGPPGPLVPLSMVISTCLRKMSQW